LNHINDNTWSNINNDTTKVGIKEVKLL